MIEIWRFRLKTNRSQNTTWDFESIFFNDLKSKFEILNFEKLNLALEAKYKWLFVFDILLLQGPFEK